MHARSSAHTSTLSVSPPPNPRPQDEVMGALSDFLGVFASAEFRVGGTVDLIDRICG